MTTAALTYRLPAKAMVLFWLLALLGAVTLGAGLFLAPERTWVNVLIVSNYLVGLGLAGLVLVALHYLTGARWSVPIRRVPEAMTAVLPVAGVGLLAVLLCDPSLYPWSAPAPADALQSPVSLRPPAWVPTAAAPAPADALHSPLHCLWLNRPFFLVRAVVYLILWSLFAAAVVRNSRRQDARTDPAPTWKNIRLSAAFLVVFGVTCWLASYDWIMSLEPEWTSTIFGVYNFAGLFLSGLAALIFLVILLRRPLKGIVNENHLHDLGTLLFSFSSFWMYTWFCQYMLIWYVNNPEETAYLRLRQQGIWPIVLLVDLVLNWGIPFLVLLFRGAKRSPLILGAIAFIVLIGRWVDLSLMILPSQKDTAPIPGVIEVGLLLGSVGLFAVAVFRSLGKASLVPVHEPIGLEEEPHLT